MTHIVDWNELWKIMYRRNNRSSRDDPGETWDKRAASFNKGTTYSGDRAEAQVSEMNLLPGDTVLDMGAGTGRLAVPMAGRVQHVTALDPSAGMLSYLVENMAAKGLTNYSVVNRRWEDTVIGTDIQVHDVVVASNSLGFYDLREELQKIDSAASRAVYLYWFAGKTRHPGNEELKRQIYGEDERNSFYPDYIFIVNILHDLGIYANVSIVETDYTFVFDDLEEAVTRHRNMWGLPDGKEELLRRYYQDILVVNDEGKLTHEQKRKRAMIWWEK